MTEKLLTGTLSLNTNKQFFIVRVFVPSLRLSYDLLFRYTYEVAPVFTLMEAEVFQKMLGLVGFADGEAIFVPGQYFLRNKK